MNISVDGVLVFFMLGVLLLSIALGPMHRGR